MLTHHGLHVRCFMWDNGSGSFEDNNERIQERLDEWLYDLIHNKTHGEWPCLDEITAVRDVLDHLEMFGQSHMEHLMLANCQGKLIARGQRFINEVLKYSIVLGQREHARSV